MHEEETRMRYHHTSILLTKVVLQEAHKLLALVGNKMKALLLCIEVYYLLFKFQ